MLFQLLFQIIPFPCFLVLKAIKKYRGSKGVQRDWIGVVAILFTSMKNLQKKSRGRCRFATIPIKMNYEMI